MKKNFWKLFTTIDAYLKFPHLQKGELGIQVGFDMTYPVTSDLFTMYKKVAPMGKVIGIDPDPNNHLIAQRIINDNNYSIQLIQKGTFNKKDDASLLIGTKSSWNQLNTIPKDSSVDFTEKVIKIEVDQLDNIIQEIGININEISHINLTINGAEYHTLLGMKKILSKAKNLSLTIIAGRHDESGTIEGKKDDELIIPLLQSYGFNTRFKRINELFWWGFIVKTLVNRKWIYHQPNFGVIMATKGNKKIKWYQSFS